jgi:hypothetical protein
VHYKQEQCVSLFFQTRNHMSAIFSSPGQRPCELLPSLGIRRCKLCVVTPVLSILVGLRHAVEHTDDYKTVHNGIIYYK